MRKMVNRRQIVLRKKRPNRRYVCLVFKESDLSDFRESWWDRRLLLYWIQVPHIISLMHNLWRGVDSLLRSSRY